MALRLAETSEGAHMAHPDFRVGGKIFATLGYPDAGFAMVRLTPEQQQALVEAEPKVYSPVKGGWGAKGATLVRLRAAKTKSVGLALTLAWRNTAPGQLLKRSAQKPR